MKKSILLLVLCAIFVSCEEIKDKDFLTSKLELRQLVKQTSTKEEAQGSYFLIAGGFSQTSEQETTVQVFAKVDGMYRLIEMPIERIRINIDNSLDKPNLQVSYRNERPKTDTQIVDRVQYYDVYIINCPEQYLPEKLLPIKL